MKENKLKIYITRYALTSGIQEAEATVGDHAPNMAVVEGTGLTLYLHGNDWHRTFESAVARAEEMRAKKLKVLDKTVRKLKDVSFAKSTPLR